MLGAIAGDIVGSVYEWKNIKTKEFPLFSDRCFYTDDSILPIALADTTLTGTPYVENLKTFYRWYPHGGYGGSFHLWARSRHSEPYNSWGNGACDCSGDLYNCSDFKTQAKAQACFERCLRLWHARRSLKPVWKALGPIMKPQKESRAEWLAREIFKRFPNDCSGLKFYELDCGCIYYRRVFRDGREDEQLGIYRNPRDGLCDVCRILPRDWEHRVDCFIAPACPLTDAQIDVSSSKIRITVLT